MVLESILTSVLSDFVSHPWKLDNHIGISRVYEVFNDQNEILALKVVNLKDSRIQEELLAEIEFLRELKTCRKVVDILEHELKSAKDVKGTLYILGQ